MDGRSKAKEALDKVMTPADHQGEFTCQRPLAVQLGGFDPDRRTQRFSMTVEDGAIAMLSLQDNLLERGIASVEPMRGQV